MTRVPGRHPLWLDGRISGCPITGDFYTEKNEHVRSKSEMILANKFYYLGMVDSEDYMNDALQKLDLCKQFAAPRAFHALSCAEPGLSHASPSMCYNTVAGIPQRSGSRAPAHESDSASLHEKTFSSAIITDFRTYYEK